MKLEIGKYYKTRNGSKCRVICLDVAGVKPVAALYSQDNGPETPYLMTDDGCCDTGSRLSIVSEWAETLEFDWSIVPSWCDHVAMDRNGIWRFYSGVPYLDINMSRWVLESGGMEIPRSLQPKGSPVRWDRSLMARLSVGKKLVGTSLFNFNGVKIT